MPRSLSQYIEILDAFVNGRIGTLEFRTRTINQYDRVDAGVYWSKEWGKEISDTLEQMDADAEVFYPEAPEDSAITEDELMRSSRRNLRRLQEALKQRGLDPRG